MLSVQPLRLAPPSRQVPLTRRQVAELLGVSVACLEKWAERGRGPRFYRKGFYKHSETAYRVEDVEQFLRERSGDDLVATLGK
jgi:phage terminase Nu1 subunit (DNA packaging protein)